MKNNPVSRIAIFGFVNPVVNVLLSASSMGSRCSDGSIWGRWFWSASASGW